VTSRHRPRIRSQPTTATVAGSRPVFAGGWHVTGPPRCPTNRAACRPVPRGWAPRPARDRAPLASSRWPRAAAAGLRAGARARRRGSPGPAAPVGDAQVVVVAPGGSRRRTCAGGRGPIAPRGTTAGTRCIVVAGGVDPSAEPYQPPRPTDDISRARSRRTRSPVIPVEMGPNAAGGDSRRVPRQNRRSWRDIVPEKTASSAPLA